MNDMAKTTSAGIEPEGIKRHLTDDEDTEGNMPIKRGALTEPGPDEPGGATGTEPEGMKRHLIDEEDTEAHMPLPSKPGSGEQSIEDTGTEPDAVFKIRP